MMGQRVSPQETRGVVPFLATNAVFCICNTRFTATSQLYRYISQSKRRDAIQSITVDNIENVHESKVGKGELRIYKIARHSGRITRSLYIRIGTERKAPCDAARPTHSEQCNDYGYEKKDEDILRHVKLRIRNILGVDE